MSAPKRILFVDDEPKVREALDRMTRSFADEWDTKFIGSGAEALEALGESSFDAIVTDLAMPEMSGADLLKEVAHRHPKTIRIVLATMSDQPLVMECASLTHQFITRPCEEDELYSSITRAWDMEAAVRHERVSKIVDRMDRLPCLPDLYLRLVEKMQDPECSIDDVAVIVAQDISMTARILKLVNSAYFGLRRRVSSPQEAVNYMGLDTVKALVLSINAFAQFEKVPLGGITLEALWNHSLMTAGFAKTIAREEGLDGRRIDEAFVAGMLHDAGKLALAANFPDDYARVVATSEHDDVDNLAAEESIIGGTHSDVGGHLLGLWGLPGAVVDAVTWHHDPLGCADQTFNALACVHAADVWSHASDPGDPHKIAEAYYERIGKDDCLGYWRDACLQPEDEGAAV